MLGFKLLPYITASLKLHRLYLYVQHRDEKRISAWILKKAAVAWHEALFRHYSYILRQWPNSAKYVLIFIPNYKNFNRSIGSNVDRQHETFEPQEEDVPLQQTCASSSLKV
jgi:hypothetical protein